MNQQNFNDLNVVTTLTGIKPTGSPHLGNYLGAIRPAIEKLQQRKSLAGERYLYFIADYHSLVSVRNPAMMKQYVYEVAATWLACGLDPEKVIFYKQSDIPEILELSWILACFTPKGDLNRAHAYKAMRQQNEEFGREDLDHGVYGGLFYYPILMAADIMLFDTNFVPVGQDQRQHIEMCRSIGQRINQAYQKELLILPQELIETSTATVVGLDGRKMSKSYDNTIPLFIDEKKLQKLVSKMKTDSLGPDVPKNPDHSAIYSLYQSWVRDEHLVSKFRDLLLQGLSWGAAKEMLFEVINADLKKMNIAYNRYMNDLGYIDIVLQKGAMKAREIAQMTMKRVRTGVMGY